MKPTTVLIVDDETNIRLMLRTTLETADTASSKPLTGARHSRPSNAKSPDVMHPGSLDAGTRWNGRSAGAQECASG